MSNHVEKEMSGADIDALMGKFKGVQVSEQINAGLKDGDAIQVGSVGAHLKRSGDPMYIFPQTTVCKVVQFIIGIRRQEASWGLETS